jgi:hypothetical protein
MKTRTKTNTKEHTKKYTKEFTKERVDRLEDALRRAHAGRPVPETGEAVVRAVMASVRSLPGYAARPAQVMAPHERLARVFYPFAAASALAATACAVWSLSVAQGLEWLLVRTVLADPTGLGALRLAGL